MGAIASVGLGQEQEWWDVIYIRRQREPWIVSSTQQEQPTAQRIFNKDPPTLTQTSQQNLNLRLLPSLYQTNLPPPPFPPFR